MVHFNSKSLIYCNRIIVDLLCMFSLGFIKCGKLKLVHHAFHLIMWICMEEVCMGCICGVRGYLSLVWIQLLGGYI